MTPLLKCVLLCLCTSVSIVSARKGVLQILDELWEVNFNILNGGSIKKRDARDDTININNNNIMYEIQTTGRENWCFCGDNNWMDTFTEKNTDLFDRCYGQYSPLFQSNRSSFIGMWSEKTAILKIHTCSVDCIFQGKKWFNSKNKLDKGLIKKYFIDNVLNEVWMKNMEVEKIVDQCLQNGGDFASLEDLIISNADKSTCNPEPFKLVLCLLFEMADNCPDDKLNQGFDCQLYYFGLEMVKNFVTRN